MATLAALKEEVKRLACERDGIEARVSESMARLSATGVGLEKPLVDGDGFPLAGLDLHAIREDRQRVVVLSNDHKALTKRIEACLQDLHAQAVAAGVVGGGGEGGRAPGVAATPRPAAQAPPPARPPADLAAAVAAAVAGPVGFAVIDEVSPASPAAAAGLRVGDRVLSAGGVGSLAALPAAVAAAAAGSSALPLTVLRDGGAVELSLSPREGWGGRGLLGCHLRPV